MNEGVWSLYYFLLFLCLMYMWRPTENSAAYAHHSELATDIPHWGDMKCRRPERRERSW